MWLKLVKKPQPYVDPDLDPVLLVPGIAGSILEAANGNGREERIWVRILAADYKLRTKLWSRFDPSTGRTVNMDPNTHITVPQDRFGLHAIDVLDPDLILGRDCVYYFHEMILEMINWGFLEGKTLFGFGYDFRQSNRLQDTLDQFTAKLESVYSASGGKKINIISHSMGGLLVKCFMSLHSDIFEKYVKNWIAIAAPFRGAPGYITTTFLNGVSFVDGWEQNFFISKWSMHQLLIECPSIYELMACPDFNWRHNPRLEIWRKSQDSELQSNVHLESYSCKESISVFEEALSNNTVNYGGVDIPLPFNLEILKWANDTRQILASAKVPASVKFYNIYATDLQTPHSVCFGSPEAPITHLPELRFCLPNYISVDGDGTVPAESAMADGLDAVARIGVPGEHRGILSDHHVFRILKHWLHAGEPDPYYNPLNDFVVLPTVYEFETHRLKGFELTSSKEEWEVVMKGEDSNAKSKSIVSSTCAAEEGDSIPSRTDSCSTVIIYPPYDNNNQHIDLGALTVPVGG
uniref:Uncharacterized protein n=1 Tax=Kalanchoe fedtschenkoi TaxID=63787 RepID=A0A7N0UER7_KALFE